MRLGSIGIGTMGLGMALNLRKESAQPVLAAGATWAGTVADVGRHADVVFTSLPGPTEMQEVGVGEGGLSSSMRSGSAWFDLSTNSPAVVREIYQRCKDKGVALLDTPVSGGPAGAHSGKLAIKSPMHGHLTDRIKDGCIKRD